MAAVKTYILAPNFTYHPNTSICMGDIIQDPSDPTKPLSSPPSSSPLATESHLDYDAHLSTANSSSLRGSVFAKFLETAEARLGGGGSRDVLDTYSIDRLETIYFIKQPTDEEAAERVKDPRVNAAINAGVFGKKPVYMVTGLKVARGLRVESGRAKGWNANAGVGVSVTAGAGNFGGGVEASGSRERAVQVSYTTGQDVVIAYQLHVISHKRWGKQVDISAYKPKAAFLNEEGDVVRDEGVEVVAADENDIRGFDEEMPITVLAASDGNEPYVCIAFDDE